MSETHSTNILATHKEVKGELTAGMLVKCTQPFSDTLYLTPDHWYLITRICEKELVVVDNDGDSAFYRKEHFDLSNPRYPEAQQSEAKRVFELLEKVYKELFNLCYLVKHDTNAPKSLIEDAFNEYAKEYNLNHLK